MFYILYEYMQNPAMQSRYFNNNRESIDLLRYRRAINKDKSIKKIERLLKQKQNDYVHFDHTSYVMVEIMEKYLKVITEQKIKN